MHAQQHRPDTLRPPFLLVLALSLSFALGCDATAMGMLATPAEASERTQVADPLAELLRSPVPEGSEIEAALEALTMAYGTESRETAMAGLGTLARTIPAVADWIPLFEAEILAKSGDVAGVQQALSRLPVGSGILERWGGASLMQALETMKGPVPVPMVEAVEELVRMAPAQEEQAEVLERLATRIHSSEPGHARSLRIEVLALAPGSRGALAAARALAPGLEVDGSPELQERVAEELERRDRWSASLPLRQALLAGQPNTERRLALARAQAEAGDGTGSLRTLDGVSTGTASFEVVRVTALFAARRDTEGMNALLALAAADPGDAGAARLLLARGLLEVERNASRALELFQLLAVSGHRPTEWDEPALSLGLHLYESGRHSDAASFLQAFAEGHPRTGPRQQALFWAAIASGRVGDMERRNHLLRAARAADPISYYGARAARLTGAGFFPADLPHGPTGSDVSPEELANAVLRLRVHVGVPTRGSYLHEVERLSRYFGEREGGIHALGEAMVTGGIPLHAARFVRMVAGDPGGNWDIRLLRTAFPFPYEDQIRAASEEAGLDPFFVAGLIRQESLFQADIRSHAGATGLMQIMPATGRGLAREMGLRGFQTIHLEEPGTNVAMGTRYIAEQLRRFGGREADALAAYNAGPGRMNRWRGLPGYSDPELWVERIPFAETRGYVKAITLNWSLYTSLYGCGVEGLEFCPHPVSALRRAGSGAVSVEGTQR